MSDRRRPRRRTSGDTRALSFTTRGDDGLAKRLTQALGRRGKPGERATHGFHTYPARLHPDAARDVLRALPSEGLVVDPFCGGGTLAVEAMLAGRPTAPSDLNPVAVMVTQARTRLADTRSLEVLQRVGERIARTAWQRSRSRKRVFVPRPVWALRDWYERGALDELGALNEAIDEASRGDDVALWLRAAHSSLVVKYSRRQSDTANRRVERPVRPGAVTRAYAARIRELAGMLAAFRDAVPAGTPPATVTRGDARTLEVSDGAATLVATSPPYPSTYDYLALQQLRFAWLDEETPLQTKEIGSRGSFRRNANRGYEAWRQSTRDWIAESARVLEAGGHLAVVIGDGLVQREVLDALDPTDAAASAAGLTLVASASATRQDHGIGRTKREHLAVYRKE